MKPLEVVDIGEGRVRISDADLHRRAGKAIWESNHIVFESLPSLMAQIIENKTWRSFQHKDFASYALDATSNGLGVNTNQRLWILRCGMDAREGGVHFKEWNGVLATVEEMVRLEVKEQGLPLKYFDGNSLEELAKKTGPTPLEGKITYLPSRASRGTADRDLMRLRAKNRETYLKVVRGDVTLMEARKRTGIKVTTDLDRAKSLVRNMTTKERREFIDWLREEGLLE